MIHFSPFPILKTNRLTLRQLTQADCADLFMMRHDPSMIEFTDSKSDETISDTAAYIDRMKKGVEDDRWILWGLEHGESGQVIGSISLWNFDWDANSAELGYGLTPTFHGRGFMTEALTGVVDYAFHTLRLSTLMAYTETQNLPSIKLLDKCGFVVVDRAAEKGTFSDRVFQMLIYQLGNPLA